MKTGTIGGTQGPSYPGFWTDSIPLLAQSFPVVAHCVTTLGLITQADSVFRFKSGDMTDLGRYRDAANRHYVVAIAMLREYAGSQSASLDVVVLCCMLCLVIEKYRGNVMAEHQHRISGSSLIETWKRTRGREVISGLMRDSIIPTFRGLDPVYGLETYEARQPAEEDHFSNALQAHSYLDQVLKDLDFTADWAVTHRMILSQDAGLVPEVGAFYEFPFLLRHTMEKVEALPPAMANTCMLLGTYHLVASILMKVSHFQEIEFDAFQKTCSLITQRAANTSLSPMEDPERNSSVPFSIGRIPLFFFVATRVRDPHMRRNALYILHKFNRREGHWDSCTAGALAKWVIEIEERGIQEVRSADDIPESRRIRVEAAAFTENEAILRYRRHPYTSIEEEKCPWRKRFHHKTHMEGAFNLENAILRSFAYQGPVEHSIEACQCADSIRRIIPPFPHSSSSSLPLRTQSPFKDDTFGLSAKTNSADSEVQKSLPPQLKLEVGNSPDEISSPFIPTTTAPD
ncbi:MAG: hypothetical protein Q9227_004598 [Pyrenula ochraceoflavens]